LISVKFQPSAVLVSVMCRFWFALKSSMCFCQITYLPLLLGSLFFPSKHFEFAWCCNQVGASFQVKRMGFLLWKHSDHSQWIYLLLKVTLTFRSTLILIPRICILARTRLMLLGSLQKSYILIRVIIVLRRFLSYFS
jgi:hypothetical protein